MKRLELKIPPLFLTLIFIVLMTLITWVSDATLQPNPARFVLALLFVAAGIAFGWMGVRDFSQASTTVNPMTPDAATELVTSGIYRFSRNPMYVGLYSAIVGYAIGLGDLYALLFGLLFLPYMNQFQIKPEERALTRRFGSKYVHYCTSVRRWL